MYHLSGRFIKGGRIRIYYTNNIVRSGEMGDSDEVTCADLGDEFPSVEDFNNALGGGAIALYVVWDPIQ